MSAETQRKPGCFQRGLLIGGGVLLGLLALGWVFTAVMGARANRIYPPQGEFVEVEGVQLHYLREGEGDQTVVFLPCGGCDISAITASPVWKMVTAEYDAIVFDRYGLGHSLGPPRDYALPSEQAALIHEALGVLGVTEPIVVGHSIGGSVAAAYIVEYPSAGAVLMGAVVYPIGEPNAFVNLGLTPVLGDMLIRIYVPVGYTLLGGAGEGGDDPFPPGYFQRSFALTGRPRQAKAALAQEAGSEEEMGAVAARYDEIDVPVIYITGETDSEQILAWGEQFTEEVPSATLRIVADGGHSFYFGHPDALLDAIGEVAGR